MKRNILVVEDNDVNLELISLLIEQYSEEKNADINLLTARNGQEAVELCSSQPIDLIFMDLMMPTMNGNEATKIIKTNHPKTMIIVISAFGDEAKQKEMLRNGAEDYMIKPVTAPLFKSRLHNYLQLIQTRNHIGNTPKARNLFTSKVYNYHMDFFISSEAELSEFWEAILIRLDFQRHIDQLSDFVRFIYRLGTFQLQQKFQFHIYVEEDVDHFFFTLDNIKLLGCEKINAIIENHYSEGVYICKGNALSFVLQKAPIEDDLSIASSSSPSVTAQTPAVEQVKTGLTVELLTTNKEEELFTFDLLDSDELEDFEGYLLKLRSLILLMENSHLEPSDIDELCHCFDEMASILTISNDTYVLSTSLRELSDAISQNRDYFKESSGQLFDFVNAFMNDLIFWKTKIFYDGAPSVDFLNDSITTNANMLNALLQPESNAQEEDLGDIFDF
ncbi:response regulator [Campylobacterota bacterium]